MKGYKRKLLIQFISAQEQCTWPPKNQLVSKMGVMMDRVSISLSIYQYRKNILFNSFLFYHKDIN